MNKTGVILIGGLNPIAAAKEADIEAENKAMCTLADYHDMESLKNIYGWLYYHQLLV